MERGSSKHSPRVDEEMSNEVRGMLQGTAGSRVEEWKMAEPAGEDQPEPTTVPEGDYRTGSPVGVSSAEMEQFSRFGRFIGRSALPGDREALRRSAPGTCRRVTRTPIHPCRRRLPPTTPPPTNLPPTRPPTTPADARPPAIKGSEA